MSKFLSIIKNTRVIILFAILLLSVIAINPRPWRDGVAIRSVIKDSAAAVAGFENPKPTDTLLSREVIHTIDGRQIRDEEDYFAALADVKINQSIEVATSKNRYNVRIKPKIEVITLNETEEQVVNETVQANETVNGTMQLVNKTVQKTVIVPKTISNIIGPDDMGLGIQQAPQNNLRKGLDLQGGTRVLLKPETPLTPESMDFLLENMRLRLNSYGLSDIVLRDTKDLEGNQFVLVEIAGATEEDVRELLAKQGKFEARIGNDTVFKGGSDITYVCKSADCSGIDPQQGCGATGQGDYACRFRFSIAVSPEAAQRQSDLTSRLEVVSDGGGQYLSKKIDLFLDNQQVDSLSIGAELKGRAVTDIAISGSGTGSSEQQAAYDALQNMKKLQTVLITGSLPVKLEIVKTDAISPELGAEFTRTAIIVSLVVMLAVAAVVYIRYRRFAVAVPIIFTMLAEILLLLGFAALVRWNIDLAAIAGIIVSAGTGVDDQIVITDEVLKGDIEAQSYNWREKIKRAFFIVFVAYAATVASMLPLLFAGAGLLKGFAFTTIVGVSFGVFVTRPAYAAVVEKLVKRDDE